MAEEHKNKKKENAKNPDSAREDLDQFTVMQESDDLHRKELSARELEIDDRAVSLEDAASQGALGKVQGVNASFGEVEENDIGSTVEETDGNEQFIEQQNPEISQEIPPDNAPETFQASENIEIEPVFQVQNFDRLTTELAPPVVDESRPPEIGTDEVDDFADIAPIEVSNSNDIEQIDEFPINTADTAPDDNGSIPTPVPAPEPDSNPEPDPTPLETNIRVRASHATDNQTDINSEDGYDFTVFEYGVPYIVTGAEMDIAGVSDESQIQYVFTDADTVEVTLLTPWNTVKNIEVFSDASGNVTLHNFVHTDIVLGDGGDSTILIDGAKRGNITTGDGNDSVEINSFTNNAGWSNNFNINTGAGDDVIDLTGDKGLTQFNVDAGDGDDQVIIDGDYYASQINLGDGNDRFIGGSGDDTVHGGEGNDILRGGRGDDTLNGGAGDDLLRGGKGEDILNGGDGNDTLRGGQGNDTLNGGEGNDILIGDSGLDHPTVGENLVLNASFEDVNVVNHGGNWEVFNNGIAGWNVSNGPGIEIQTGGTAGIGASDGNNKVELDSHGGTDTNSGMYQDIPTQTDHVFTLEFDYAPRPGVSAGSNVIEVYWDGELFDTLSLNGGSGWETYSYEVTGNAEDGTTRLEFRAGGTDDSLGGLIDNVSVALEELSPGFQNDLLNGGAGDDTLIGGIGDDTLNGGTGDDILNGGQGNDILNGGTGDDTLAGGSGNDALDGGDGNDTLDGGAGNDGLSGGAGDNTLNGGDGNDMIYGGNGDDTLDGGNGTDTLIGGDGTDTLIGGAGSDTLTGGDGKDTFIITSGDGDVTITDFGGVGGGGYGETALIGNYDTIKLDGEGLNAESMLLEFDGTNTIMTFEGVDGFSVTLEDFDFTDLDNLPANSSFNILFDGQETGTDAYDVFNDHSNNQHGIWNTNSVTHLNDTDNTVNGRDNSDDVINGMEGDDTIGGKSGDDTLRGQSGNDTLTGGKGDDLIDGGIGDDVAVFAGNRSEYSVVQNEDGTYTVTDSVAGRDGTDTLTEVETFRFADGDLSEGEEVLAEFECETTVELSFMDTNAGYNNTIGVYTIAEDGTIGNVEIAFENVKDNDQGDTYEMSVTGDDTAQFGFFIIADGARKNNNFNNFDLENGELQFVFDQGEADERPATIHDDPAEVSLVYNDGETTEIIDGHIYHDTPDLNPNDLDYVHESDLSNGGQRLGFEDLPNLGDQDYNDVIIDVNVTKQTVPLSDSDDGQDDNNGNSDNGDDGNNGHGNDPDGVDDSNPGIGNDMPAMMDNSDGDGWTDMVENDETMMGGNAENSGDEAWTDSVENSGAADNDNSSTADDNADNPLDNADADIGEIPTIIDDQSGASDNAFG